MNEPTDKPIEPWDALRRPEDRPLPIGEGTWETFSGVQISVRGLYPGRQGVELTFDSSSFGPESLFQLARFCEELGRQLARE